MVAVTHMAGKKVIGKVVLRSPDQNLRVKPQHHVVVLQIYIYSIYIYFSLHERP